VDADQARDLYRQVLDLRELLAAVARDLERLAGTEPDPERRGVLLRRAMRIRERLHQG
jgi:predicted component of type VI protein secretion system